MSIQNVCMYGHDASLVSTKKEGFGDFLAG